MKNKSLIALLVGFSIPTVIMPILNSLVEVAEGQFEIIKGGQIKKITEINIDNTKLQQELEELQQPICTNAIGYEVPNEGWVYGDECQNKETNKCPVGFH